MWRSTPYRFFFRRLRFRLPVLLLMIMTMTAFDTAARAAENGNMVEVVGRAAASQPNARRAALEEAFRTAIEQAVAVQVSSETTVRNSSVLNDQIYVYAEGFIEKWEVLTEEVKDDLLTLRVKALVREGRLNKTLFLNGLPVNKIYDWIGAPRVLLLMQDIVDNQPSQTNLTQTTLENIFIEKGISVFDQTQLEKIQERDRQLAFSSPEKAVTLGKRLGAEMVVTGKCISNFSRQLTVGQFTLNFYTAMTQIRAYNTATGKVILSENYSPDPARDTSAIGKFDASVNAIKASLEGAGEDILFKIVRNWYDDFSRPQVYDLIVEGTDYRQLQELKQGLHGLQGFVSLQERSFNNNVAELEVKYEALAGPLPDAIMAAGLPYEITRKEQQRIFLKRGK